MDDATRAEKQASLEKCMGKNMEDRRAECAHADGEKHVAELAHGGIGQDFLNIVLRQRDRGGEECRGRANPAINAKVAGARAKRKCSRAVI